MDAEAARYDSRVAKLLKRTAWLEPTLYGLVAGALTLYVATRFFGSLKLQLAYARAWAGSDPFGQYIEQSGYWSAPLDDVFIHFDFARSIVRGHPFEWSQGGGYSSGGTSLLYPFVLALGLPMGFGDMRLMEWAAIVACLGVFVTLLYARRLFSGLPLWTSYLAPFALLSVGALDWTLFSGMEVALFLALWAGAFATWDALFHAARRPAAAGTSELSGLCWALGGWCAALVATRPEAATLVALFGITALWPLAKSNRALALHLLARVAVPGALIVLAHAVANRLLTGDSTAAGALVKLEAHHPYFTPAQVWDAWWFHLKYQVLRVTQYHLSDPGWLGWGMWLLAAAAFIPRATRRYAALLWASAALWTFVVAFNGQVRWQNERYSMPALAWLLLSAALGLAGLLVGLQRRDHRPWRIAGALAGVAITLVLAVFQAPRFREQLWFFGRASRNILEQHVRAALVIREGLREQPRRVMVGDAGAIPYVADLPALDIIGLGGFQGLPFARATRAHVGAGLELVERIDPEQRPDLMALYPSWWGELPLWFGHTITEVPVRGNVICGGQSKVLYRADYAPFEGSATPVSLRPGERVTDDIDVADLISEREQGYRLSADAIGFVTMKLLAHPKEPKADLWDAGRIVAPGVSESFRLHNVDTRRPFRLIARIAPSGPFSAPVSIGGERVGTLRADAADAWQEIELAVPPLGKRAPDVVLESSPHERTTYHLWAVQPP